MPLAASRTMAVGSGTGKGWGVSFGPWVLDDTLEMVKSLCHEPLKLLPVSATRWMYEFGPKNEARAPLPSSFRSDWNCVTPPVLLVAKSIGLPCSSRPL